MREKSLCPFFNVEYCKYKDKCSDEHAKHNCEDPNCKKKGNKGTENLTSFV